METPVMGSYHSVNIHSIGGRVERVNGRVVDFQCNGKFAVLETESGHGRVSVPLRKLLPYIK